MKDKFAKMKNFSKVLIIFNGNFFHKKLSALHAKSVYLFPLTSDWRLIYKIESIIRNLSVANIKIKSTDSAEMIDKEVDVLREKVSKWSANLGDFVMLGKSIKDWFLLPKEEVSTWWFSLLSEIIHLKRMSFSVLLNFKLWMKSHLQIPLTYVHVPFLKNPS